MGTASFLLHKELHDLAVNPTRHVTKTSQTQFAVAKEDVVNQMKRIQKDKIII